MESFGEKTYLFIQAIDLMPNKGDVLRLFHVGEFWSLLGQHSGYCYSHLPVSGRGKE